MQTKTAVYDPKAYGRAERFLGILKRRATSYLTNAGISLTIWYWAACQAAIFVLDASTGNAIA
eukprot:12938540-Prorocentrum_lima.AAC.1